MGSSVITIRIDNELLNIIDKFANMFRLNRSQVIKQAIELYFLMYITKSLPPEEELWKKFEEMLKERNQKNEIKR